MDEIKKDTQQNPNGEVVIHAGMDVGDMAVRSMLEGDEVIETPATETPENNAGAAPAPEATPGKDAPASKPEEKPEENKGDGEPFAVVGTRSFKTKEEFVEEYSRSSGMNQFIVGHLKKIHPDWYDDKGQLNPNKLREAVKEVNKVQEKAEEVKAGNPVNLSETERKAVAEELKAQGFVDKDEVASMIKAATANATQNNNDNEDLAIAAEVSSLLEKHPELTENPALQEEFADLIDKEGDIPESMRRSVEELWDFFAKKKGIAKLTPEEEARNVDSSIPSSIPRSGGLPPSNNKGDTDFFDSMISSNGM